MKRLIDFILRWFEPDTNKRWSDEKEVKYIEMGLNGKLQVTKHIYEK